MLNKYLLDSTGNSGHRLLVIHLRAVFAALSKYQSFKVQNLLEHIWFVTLVLRCIMFVFIISSQTFLFFLLSCSFIYFKMFIFFYYFVYFHSFIHSIIVKYTNTYTHTFSSKIIVFSRMKFNEWKLEKYCKHCIQVKRVRYDK